MSQVQLPSLKNLQLLPNPNIQENSYLYPDTSEPTPLWKQNLLEWCKETSYEQYLQINAILQMGAPLPKNSYGAPYSSYNHSNYTYHSERTQHHIQSQHSDTESPEQEPANLTVLANAALSVFDQPIPVSVVSGRDQFYELSDSSVNKYYPSSPSSAGSNTIKSLLNNNNANDYQSLHHYPGHSSTQNSSSATPPASPEQKLVVFTPIVSDRMIDSIKISKTGNHKKSNSFKARQMKKILSNRDILNENSLSLNIVNSAEIKGIKDLQEYKKKNMKRLQRLGPGSLASPQLTPGLKLKSQVCTPHQSQQISDNEHRSHVTPLNSKALQMPQLPHSQNIMTPPSSPQHSQLNLASKSSFSPVNSPISIVAPRSSPKHTPHSPKKQGKSNSRRNSNEEKAPRTCISCGSTDSPCWRPSWSSNKHEQLCNSCGLRYKKTSTRCLNMECKKIPSKGELSIMKSNGMTQQYIDDAENPHAQKLHSGFECLFCGHVTDTVNKP